MNGYTLHRPWDPEIADQLDHEAAVRVINVFWSSVGRFVTTAGPGVVDMSPHRLRCQPAPARRSDEKATDPGEAWGRQDRADCHSAGFLFLST